MVVSVTGLSPKVQELYKRVKSFIETEIAHFEKEYVKHTQSDNRWQIFEPIEQLKVNFFFFLVPCDFLFVYEYVCVLTNMKVQEKCIAGI